MNEFALVHRGSIVNVVTTSLTKSQLQEQHPTYQVQELGSLPSEMLEAYRYWRDRP